MRFQCSECHGIVAIDDADFGEPVGCGHCGAVVPVPKSRFAPGVMINDFIIRDTLGHGGMGTVYLAHQFSLDRPVALKILMEQFSTNSEFIVDFVKEARAAASLNHPNIVQSYAVGEEDGIYFFAMEYVEGKTLKQMMDAEGQLPLDRTLNIIQQIAEALDFAWKQKQLVHRDIKPDNIMLTHRGVAKLADLGLARMAHETLDDDDDLVMGTPQYICPEQLLGQPMDVRGDVYSLGATLYHALTGQFPFDGKNASEIARKHLQEAAPDPQSFNPDLPDTVCWVLRKMMAKKIENRYEDAHELAIDLGYILKGERPVGYEAEEPEDAKSKKPKTKGKVRLSVAGPSNGAAAKPTPKPTPKPKTTGGGLVTADRSTSTNLTAATVQQPAAAAAATATAEAEPESGARYTKIKVTSKKSGKSISVPVNGAASSKGASSLSVPAATGTRTPTGARTPAAAKPPKKGLGIGIILALAGVGLVLLGIVVAVILFVKTQTHWDPQTKRDLVDLYWSLPTTTDAERQAYEAVEPMFGQAEKLRDNAEMLEKNSSALGKFMTDYPKSLFALPPDAIDYEEMFDPPGFGAGANLPLRAKSTAAAGEVARELEIYNAYLLEELRDPLIQEELDLIEENRQRAETRKKLTVALEEIPGLIAGRKRAINEEIEKLTQEVVKKETRLADEQDKLRHEILKEGRDLSFTQAITALQINANSVLAYGAAVGKRASAWSASEESGKTNDLDTLARNHSELFRIPEYATEIRKSYEDAAKEAGLATLKNEKVRELTERDDAVLQKRSDWFKLHETWLQNAQDYMKAFETGKDNITGMRPTGRDRRIPMNRSQKLRVGGYDANRREVIFEVFIIDPSTANEIVQNTVRIGLRDLDDELRAEIANTAWGALELAKLRGNQAAFLTYTAEVASEEKIASLLDQSGQPGSDALKAELPAFGEIAWRLFAADIVAHVDELVKAGKVKDAQTFFNTWDGRMNDKPGWEESRQKCLDLLP